MTYKRQMEKALKEYLTPLGFKYKASEYSFIKKLDEELTLCIAYLDDTGYRPHYYHLRVFVTVTSKTLNEILHKVTEGIIDYRNSSRSSPTYINVLEDGYMMETEFIGDRSMEENIALFDTLYKTKVQKVFDKYSNLKAIFTQTIHEPYFNVLNSPCIWYYVPLLYYFEGEFDKAMAFIDERLEIANESEKRILKRFSTLSDEDKLAKQAFTIYKENLRRWIEEHKQLKVDNELLPVSFK